MKVKSIFIILILLLGASAAEAQETIFSLLKSEIKLADTYFVNKDYRSALRLYNNIERKNPSKDLELKIARSHFFLKQYKEAVAVYEKSWLPADLPTHDLHNYAEAQSGALNYEKAIETYQVYLTRVPDDEFVMKKVWRLNNKQFLFEDSSHYAVNRLTMNTTYGELGAVPYKNGLAFVSNRKGVQPIEKIDGFSHTSFYKIFFAPFVSDTMRQDSTWMGSPATFGRLFNSKFHMGSFAFYDRQNKMVFTSTSAKTGKNGERTLQLYFAENKAGQWKIIGQFPYNSLDYSVSDPAVNSDGTILYFSSDMKGGFGKKDLYRSEYKNGQWSKPLNLGEIINTNGDEVFPFIFQGTLYFASNGHAGLGGLDIFRADGDTQNFGEPQNMGYPLNTNFDDFGLQSQSWRI
jgi:tetratricopeptide (TPR) repeat protein